MGAACSRRAPERAATAQLPSAQAATAQLPSAQAERAVTAQLPSAQAERPVIEQLSSAQTGVPVTVPLPSAPTGGQFGSRYVYPGLPVPAAVPWLPQGARTGLPLRKFQRVVKRIRNILALRRLWSSLGAWLNVSLSRGHRSRPAVAWTFSYLGRKVVRVRAPLFAHLVRKRGHLQYRDAALERRQEVGRW
jgi:hypothetical protein